MKIFKIGILFFLFLSAFACKKEDMQPKEGCFFNMTDPITGTVYQPVHYSDCETCEDRVEHWIEIHKTNNPEIPEETLTETIFCEDI